jgi:hypothetical protein
MEIMIATLIASFAAAAILNVGVQSSKIVDRLKKRETILAPLSIAALHGKKDFHNTERSFESLLGGAYAIDHEGLKRYLQDRSALYTEELVDRWRITSDSTGGVELPRFEIVLRTIAINGLEGRVYAIQKE